MQTKQIFTTTIIAMLGLSVFTGCSSSKVAEANKLNSIEAQTNNSYSESSFFGVVKNMKVEEKVNKKGEVLSVQYLLIEGERGTQVIFQTNKESESFKVGEEVLFKSNKHNPIATVQKVSKNKINSNGNVNKKSVAIGNYRDISQENSARLYHDLNPERMVKYYK